MSSALSTQTELTNDLCEFARNLNKTPTVRELNKYGPHSASTYQKVFGSWNKALRTANLNPNRVHNISPETLKDDIERVAGVLGRAPTLSELDRFGEYGPATYCRILDSYVGTLEELELDTRPRQYNYSDREPPRDKQATKNVRKLREEGPLPSSKLPSQNFGLHDRRHGMASFSISTGLSGKPESVFYLFEDHDPEEVLRIFFEIHPEVLENKSYSVITEKVGGYGKSWRQAVRRVL
jgi:hypothetical protein